MEWRFRNGEVWFFLCTESIGLLVRSGSPCITDALRYAAVSAVWEVCFRKKIARGIHDMNRLAETIKVRPLEIISWSLG